MLRWLPVAIFLIVAIGGLATLLVVRAAEPIVFCVDPQMREEIRALMLEGAGEALKRQTRDIYRVWKTDRPDPPHQAKRGLDLGIEAYVRARKAIEQWQPDTCEVPVPRPRP